MSNFERDVFRVEGTETGIYTSIRERQNGYTLDSSSDPHYIIHKYAGGVYAKWPDEIGINELISEGLTGLQINDENVAVSISNAPTLITQEQVNEFLLRPDLAIVYFNDNQEAVEKGDSISSVSLDWGITGSISSVTIEDSFGSTGVSTGYSGAATYPYTPPLGETGSYTYTLTVMDGAGDIMTDTESFYFGLYIYWGQSAQPYSSINETIIEAASNGGSTLSPDTSSSKSKAQFSQPGGGNYIYYAYPQSWGALNSIKVNGFNSTWDSSTVSVTNAQGNTENYYAYVSPYAINGTVTLEFS